MSQVNDRKVLEAVSEALDADGIARFDGGRYTRTANKAPSRTVLKRLAEEGYVEVESHNVSTWGYGFKANYFTHSAAQAGRPLNQAQQDDLAREARLKDVVEPRQWQDRTEVWVRITSRGSEYLEMLRALS